MRLVLLCLTALIGVYTVRIHIGALVNEFSLEAKIINYVIDYVNGRNDLLPNYIVQVRYPVSDDIHENLVYEALHMVQEGVSVIISPRGSDDILVLHRLLAPKLITQLAPTETSDTISRKNYLIQLNTPNLIMNRAICNSLSSFNWTRVAVLTSEGEWSQYIQNLWNSCMSNGVTIATLQEHKIPPYPAFVEAEEELKIIKNANTRVVILFTSMSYVPTIMRDAFDLGLLEAGYAWVVVDIHSQFSTVYEDGVPPGFPPYLRGLIVLRPLMSDGNLLREFSQEWYARGIGTVPLASLYSDAVLLFCYALHEMTVDDVKFTFRQSSINLLGEERWEPGEELFKYMLKQRFNGVSREIQFDPIDMSVVDKRFGLFNVADGIKTSDYIDYEHIGLSKIGYWEPEGGVQIYRNSHVVWPSNQNNTPSDRPQSLKGKMFKVVTIESPPFVMVDRSRTGNARYKGFLPDMIEKLKARLHFDYELYEVEDNTWGGKDPVTGQWGGVVGDVVKGKAHFTLADLAVTSARDEAVRYSQSYFRSGMSLSMAVEDPQKEMFYWMSPLGWNVWGAVLLFAVICAVFMSSYSKLSPFGFYGRYNHSRDDATNNSDECKHRFSFKNCIWFIISSFFQQGPDNGSPTCISGRIVATTWWVFCLLIIIMYTANLTANLTVSNMKKPIDSLESLLTQREYTFGSVKGTSYENIFNGSRLKLYKMIAANMLWLNSSSEAYNKTTQEKFIFIWDSPQIDYNQPKYGCKFTRVGSEFGYSQYSLAFPKNNDTMNHVVELIDREILAMVEVSELKKSFEEWLSGSTKVCEQGVPGRKEALSTKDLKGLFVVMLGLLLISFVAFISEVCFAAYLDKRQSTDENMTMADAVRARWIQTLNTAADMPLMNDLPQFGENAGAEDGKINPEISEREFVRKFKKLGSTNEAQS